ncbi:DUF4347 domain-containing protein [Pseudothauera nasutitermitis]|uniref:DUF4347 domain-containing protein n=1 Tax=Pseudothauera nasutitermitis TaxID=2565930 RepID=A0A4S4AUQ5_9RHOO|nr:DUF4347 domain-containing protein [Pseudothauera nasutitermitis]THF63628.1 DUF4347 domain-containing protein [Pseudothauera nasutitermitis]
MTTHSGNALPRLPSKGLLFSGIRPLALEQRFMFDGAAVAEAAQALAGDGAATADVPPLLPPPLENGSGRERQEVVFVDTSVSDYRTLVAGIRAGVEIVMIDGGRSGLAQVAEWAQGRSGYDAIHILSHGSTAALYLGSDRLSTADLDGEAVQASLAQIGAALTESGDLLLYGCDIGAGEDGLEFLGRLAEATGADVVASEDATGAATLGGNWVLERQTGSIESLLALSASGVGAYGGLLATFDLEATSSDDALQIQQTVGVHTVTFAAEKHNLLVGTGDDLLSFTPAGMSGRIMLAGFDPDATGSSESKLTISVDGGKIFDLASFTISDLTGDNQYLTITTDKGSQTFDPSFIGSDLVWNVSLSGELFESIAWAEITTSTNNTAGAKEFYWAFDNFILNNINNAPTLTGAGVGQSFTEGDSPTSSLFSGITANTNDAGENFTGLTLTVTNVGSGESLSIGGTGVALTNGASGAISGGGSYAVSVSGGTATVSLTGLDRDNAAMQSLVESITYSNTSDDPGNASRVVTLTGVSDSPTHASGATPNIAATVSITPVNDAPTLSATGTNPTYTENGSAVDLFSGVGISTIEAGQTITELTLTVSNLANGASEILRIDGTDVALTDGASGTTTGGNAVGYTVSVSGGTATVTLSKAGGLNATDAQSLVDGMGYRNDSEAPGTASRVVTLTSITDSGGTANNGSDTANLSIISTVAVVAVNDAPTLSGGPFSLPGTDEDTASGGTPVSTILAGLSVADPDGVAVAGIAITASSGNGTWQYSTDGVSWNGVGSVSNGAALLLSASTQVRYVPDGANGETATLTFRAWDATSGSASTNTTRETADTGSNGGITAFSTGTAQAGMTIGSVNDAPVLTPAAPTLTGLNDTDTNNPGQTVASIVGASITDVDTGALEGIAITGLDAGNGTWQYSLDGSTWTDIGSVSVASALLLRASDHVRFVPDGANGTTAGITYRAWDQTGDTAGQQGTKVDTAGSGGSSAFSTASDTAGITVVLTPPPQVTGVTSATTDGTYKIGDTISIQVSFSENVTVTGTPTLALASGGTATYAGGSGTNTLTFTYTVAAGHASADLDFTSTAALSAAGGSVQGSTGKDAALTLPSPGDAGSLGANKDLVVDGIAPAVSGNLSVPANGTYGAGQTLDFTVTFDDTVTITGTGSTLTLDIGGVARQATFLSKTGTSVTYRYTVQVGDSDADGIAITSIALNGDTIRDAAGNDAALSLAGHLPSLAGVLVDAALPELSGNVTVADGSYKAGDVLSFTVPLNKAVTVNTGGGSPTLDITIGATSRSAVYDAAASTATALVFTYTVQAGETDGDGIAIDALSLNGAVIQDSHGNHLDATLTGHLPPLAGVLVDTTAPTVASVSTPADGTYKAGDTLSFTVNYDEAVTVDTTGGTPRIALTLDTGGTVYADYVSGSGTTALTFAYTVSAGNYADHDGITVGALSANGGTLRDTAGNDAALTLNSIGATGNVWVDGRSPVVTSVAVPADATYTQGQALSFTVNFDMAVTVDTTGGTPRLALTLDTGGTVYADYVSGSGGTALVFSYTVAGGHQDHDGVAIGALALNGGTLRNAAGNDAVLTLGGVGATAGVLVDAKAPDFVAATVDGATLTLTYDEALDAANPPTAGDFTITVAGNPVAVAGVSVNGPAVTLTLAVPVTAGQAVTVAYVDPSAGDDPQAIQDQAGQDAASLAATAVANLTPATAPAVASVSVPADGTYKAGDTLSFTVNYDEAVTVDTTGGTPRIALTLNTGGTVYADYVSGSGGTALVFAYTVADGHQDHDGIAIGALSANGGTLRSATGNDAVLTLDGVGDTDGVRVDGIAPTVSAVSVPTDGTYTAGQTLAFTVHYGEAVTVDSVGGTPRIALALDSGGTVYADYVSGSGGTALLFHYTVQPGDHGSVTVGALGLNGGAIRDAAGNDAAPALNGVGDTDGVRVDARAPVFVSATVNGATLTLTYDEALDAANPPTAGDFTVTVAGDPVGVSGVAVNGPAGTVTLTLAAPVTAGQAVTVAYADPSMGDDPQAIQDLAGQDAASLAPTAVTNQTPTSPAPELEPPPRPDSTPPVPHAGSMLAIALPVPQADPLPPSTTVFLSSTVTQGLSGIPAFDSSAASFALAGLGAPMAGAGMAGDTAEALTPPQLPGGFQAVVLPRPAGMPDTLQVLRGMADVQLSADGPVEIAVPVDAFAHTNPDATVQLAATLADGSPLPAWIRFDTLTGTLLVDAPDGFEGELLVRLVARDNQGREAVTTFRIVVARENQEPAGRAGLHEQIRQAAPAHGLSIHLAALSHSAEAARQAHA